VKHREGEAMDEPIEDYLDALLLRLRVSPRETRRIINETEAHLHDACGANSTTWRVSASGCR